jgi:hypothetical protein
MASGGDRATGGNRAIRARPSPAIRTQHVESPAPWRGFAPAVSLLACAGHAPTRSRLAKRFTSSKEETENFTFSQNSACNPGGPPIEERSRPTGTPLPSDAPQAAKTIAVVTLTHLQSGQIIIVVPGFSAFREIRKAPEKKLLTGCFERIISRLRRRRRAHRPGPLDQSKAFAADLENDTGQEPGSPGE